MSIPRVARADLTSAKLVGFHWRDSPRSSTPFQTAHVVTVLGFETDAGAITVTECRADRSDSSRYCALLRECSHETTDRSVSAWR